MQLVILAGGKGTRLGLKDIPKPMVSIAGKPLLEYQIELAKQYNIDEIFILEGYLANIIKDYFGDGSKWGVKIHHIIEPKPLGTAGALKLLKGKLQDRFLVFYGDIVMDFDIESFKTFDMEHKGIASILVHPNTHPYDSDLVEIDKNNKVLSFLSKPHPENLIYHNLVNAAVYILSCDIVDYIQDGILSDFGKNIFPKVLDAGENIFAYQTAEYIKDIGTKERFPLVCNDVENGKVARLNKKNKRPAIFIDRDGTINKNMDKHPSVENFEFLPEVVDGIKLINKSDYLGVIITNQPMIAKGFVNFEDIDNIHKKLETELGNNNCYIDGIYYCPHHPEKGFKGEIAELKIECDCRKPKIGLFLHAQKDFNIDFSRSWMIGDSEIDIEAGNASGCKTIAVEKLNGKSIFANYNCKNLKEAVNLIMEKTK